MKRCLASYVIRELKIKLKQVNQYPPIRMAKSQNTDNNKGWWGLEQQELSPWLLLGMQRDTVGMEDKFGSFFKNYNTISHIYTNFINNCQTWK